MKQLVLVAGLLACGTRAPQQPAGDDPVLEPIAAPTVARTRGDSSGDAGYVGVLTPRSSAEVTAPFTTTLVEVTVKLGDRVEKGQTLGRLDDRPLREELAIAQAALRATQAESAQAGVAQRAASSVLERERRAYRDKIVAEAQVVAAEFDERKAELAVAGSIAAVEEQRAKIARLKAKLVDTTLVAPLPGRVALTYARPGERVVEGQPIVRLISSDELFVKFAIPAESAGSLAVGRPVNVTFEAQRLEARAIVRHVAPELDPIAQMIMADAELVDPPAQLQSGMVCRIVPETTPADARRSD